VVAFQYFSWEEVGVHHSTLFMPAVMESTRLLQPNNGKHLSFHWKMEQE
jgi:hypothetical protein